MKQFITGLLALILPLAIAVAAPSKAESARTMKTVKKAKETNFPDVNFRQANLRDVIDVLNEMSISGDPSGKREGVNIVLAIAQAEPQKIEEGDSFAADDPFGDNIEPEGVTADSGLPLITFRARRISLYETLKIVARLSGLKVRVEGSVVMLVPKNAPDKEMQVRTYNVLPTITQRISDLRGEMGQPKQQLRRGF